MAVDGVTIPRAASPSKQQLAQPKRQRAREPSLGGAAKKSTSSPPRRSSGATQSAAAAAEKQERVWTFQRTWTFGGAAPKTETAPSPPPQKPPAQAEAAPE
jgi:hypothetical protein